MTDCLVCGLDRADCECDFGLPEDADRRADRELVTLFVLDATDVLKGVPGFPDLFHIF